MNISTGPRLPNRRLQKVPWHAGAAPSRCCAPCATLAATPPALCASAGAPCAGPDAPGGAKDWCCSFDADVPLLLSVEEEEQYLARSLKAALNASACLFPCPQPGCEGCAVAGGGESQLLHSYFLVP